MDIWIALPRSGLARRGWSLSWKNLCLACKACKAQDSGSEDWETEDNKDKEDEDDDNEDDKKADDSFKDGIVNVSDSEILYDKDGNIIGEPGPGEDIEG